LVQKYIRGVKPYSSDGPDGLPAKFFNNTYTVVIIVVRIFSMYYSHRTNLCCIHYSDFQKRLTHAVAQQITGLQYFINLH